MAYSGGYASGYADPTAGGGAAFDTDTTIIVEVAFGHGPDDDGPVWTDETAFVQRVKTRRGKNTPLGRFQAGTATIWFRNEDGRYDPNNTSSPHSPNVKVMVPVRIRAVNNSVTYDVWRGVVETWPITYRGGGNVSTVTVTAVDDFKTLAREHMSGAAFAAQRTSERVDTVLDDVGWPSSRRSIGQSASNVQAVTPAADESALSHVLASGDTEAGALFMAADGNLTFRPRVELAGGLRSKGTFGPGTALSTASVGFAALGRAELLLQASNYSGSGEWLDESGNGHHAQFGSTSGSDTNDPLFLSWTGLQYLYLPGINGNYADTPDTAPLSITGDIDMRVKLMPDDLTPAAIETPISKWGGAIPEWYLRILTNGTWGLVWRDGANQALSANSTAMGFTAGVEAWGRVTVDANNGAGSSDVTFYRSDDDGATWVTINVITPVSTDGALQTSTAPVRIGSREVAAEPFAGRIYRAQIYSDLTETTLALDADFTNTTTLVEPFATFVEASSNGATVTINRVTSGRVSTVVDRTMLLLGSDDQFVVPDHANLDFTAGQDFTLMVAGRRGTATPVNEMLAGKGTVGGAASWVIYYDAPTGNAVARLGSTLVLDQDESPPAEQVAFVHAMVRDGTAPSLELFTNGVGTGTPDTAVSDDLTSASALTIGSSVTPNNHYAGEIHAVALWREALSDADVAAAGEALFAELDYMDIGLSYDDDFLYNDVRITRTGGVEQVAEDASSQTDFGQVTLTRTGTLHADDNECLNNAEWIRDVSKDVRVQVRELVVSPRGDDALWTQVLERELRDAVKVKIDPPGTGNVLDQLVIINSISHDIDATRKRWVTTFGTAAASALETQDFWVLGTSVLDTTTNLA